MSDEHWQTALSRSLQVFLNGHGLSLPDDHGEPILDDTFLVLFHAHPENRKFTFPAATFGAAWERVMDTERGFAGPAERDRHEAGSEIDVLARSVWLFRRVP